MVFTTGWDVDGTAAEEELGITRCGQCARVFAKPLTWSGNSMD